MAEDFDQPTVIFEEAEDGFMLKLAGWEEVLEMGYKSFEGIRKTFQTSDEVIPELLEEVDEGTGDTSEEYIRMINPPQQLVDDPDWQKHILDSLYNHLAEVGLYHIAEDEMAEELELINQQRFKTLLVRQSAFFEDFLVVLCQTTFQAYANRVLSNKEMSLIDQMGHEDRTRLAYLLGAITEKEHGYLQEMVSARNEIAHNSWTEFTQENEQRFETVAQKVNTVLGNFFEKDEEEAQVPVIDLSVLEDEEPPEDFE